jgi:hypothetical protein
MANGSQAVPPAGPAAPPAAAAAPAAALARAAEPAPPSTEDARFIAFAKENIGLLASVAAVPLLSSAAGALKPPQQLDQLTVLSSLLCIIVFAACFTLRGLLGALPKSRYTLVKALPGLLSLLIVGVAIWQIAIFSSAEYDYKLASGAKPPQQENVAGAPKPAALASAPATEAAAPPAQMAPESTVATGAAAATGAPASAPAAGASGAASPTTASPATTAPVTASPAAAGTAAPPGETPKDAKAGQATQPGQNQPRYNLNRQILLFLGIYPTMILALGLILVTSFTQQTARDIQTVVEQSLPEQADALFKRLQLMARFYEIGRQPGQERFLKIGEALMENRNEILHNLSIGMIEVGGPEAMHLQQELIQTFKNSFDAVSCCDLKFWTDIGTDEISRNYFRLNLEALKRSNKVTRLLIFDDNELARTADVVKALDYHQRSGIAWAVVPYMDLDPSTREESEDLALDFALYDDSEVAIYFRDYHAGARKLRAVFPGPDRRDYLIGQRKRYKELLAQCWLVSSTFLDRLNKLPPAELVELRSAAVRNAQVTAREIGLTEEAAKFEELRLKLDDPKAPGTPDLKDCYLFPNCEGDISANVQRMYNLRRQCPDWGGPR